MANKEAGQISLAVCQGGSGSDVELVQSPTTTNQKESRFDEFLKRGEEILDTFTQLIKGFEAQSLQIRHLAQEVSHLKGLSVGKRSNVDVVEGATVKRMRTEAVSSDGSPINDIDQIMNESDATTSSETMLDPCIDDISSFIVQDEKLGDDVKSEVAQVVNVSLRSVADGTKLKSLLESHKRPGNMTNLQVSRVDRFLWDQLNQTTKSQDIIQQKSIAMINQALIPLIKAMDHISGNGSPDLSILKSYIGDNIKIQCDNVHKLNLARREAIKKELFLKFKTLCSEDQAISATGLFGDNLAEQTKNMEPSKLIKMTDKGNQKNFLFKRGKGRPVCREETLTIPTPPLTQPTQPIISATEIWEIRTDFQKYREKLQGEAIATEDLNSNFVSIRRKSMELINTKHNFRAGKT